MATHIYRFAENFQGLIHSGLTNILGTPDGKVHRNLTRDS